MWFFNLAQRKQTSSIRPGSRRRHPRYVASLQPKFGTYSELGDDEPQWILEHSKAEKRRRALEARADLETRLAKVREREKKLKERFRSDAPAFKRRVCPKLPLALNKG